MAGGRPVSAILRSSWVKCSELRSAMSLLTGKRMKISYLQAKCLNYSSLHYIIAQPFPDLLKMLLVMLVGIGCDIGDKPMAICPWEALGIRDIVFGERLYLLQQVLVSKSRV